MPNFEKQNFREEQRTSMEFEFEFTFEFPPPRSGLGGFFCGFTSEVLVPGGNAMDGSVCMEYGSAVLGSMAMRIDVWSFWA